VRAVSSNLLIGFADECSPDHQNCEAVDIVCRGSRGKFTAEPQSRAASNCEAETGYVFGATADGKWIKAEEAAKALQDEMTYHVYGLTESLGEAKGSQPKPSEEDVCSDVLAVSLSPKPEGGAIALAAPWNALPRKPQVTDRTQKTYVDAVRKFLRMKEIEQPKVKLITSFASI
jgi:hypothetical protein